MDTLLSHEAMGENLWSDATDTGRLHVNNNIVNVVCLDYIHAI